MRKKISKKDIIDKLGQIAFGKCNDPVKLAFMDEDMACIDLLDLSMVSEIKHNSNGGVEIKLVNRLEAMKLLAELLEQEKAASGKTQSAAEGLMAAIDRAAEVGFSED